MSCQGVIWGETHVSRRGNAVSGALGACMMHTAILQDDGRLLVRIIQGEHLFRSPLLRGGIVGDDC